MKPDYLRFYTRSSTPKKNKKKKNPPMQTIFLNSLKNKNKNPMSFVSHNPLKKIK